MNHNPSSPSDALAEQARNAPTAASPFIATALPTDAAQRPKLLPYLVVLGGVLIVSTAAILITIARDHGAGSLPIAAGRLGIAAALLTPLALGRERSAVRRVARRDLGLALVAGGFLAVHFASWITSLRYTSVASSTALVATNPLFVGLASALVFRERLSRAVWLGIALTITGAALIGLSDSNGGGGSNPLLGDALALLGAATASGYFLTGRSLRRRLDIVPYIWLVYGMAAVILLAWMLLAGETLFGLDAVAYGCLLALALGPQLLGHTAFNWAIRYVSATFIAVAILGEPIGSAILAFVVFRQPLAALQIVGGLVLLGGIAIVSLVEARPKAALPQESHEPTP